MNKALKIAGLTVIIACLAIGTTQSVQARSWVTVRHNGCVRIVTKHIQHRGWYGRYGRWHRGNTVVVRHRRVVC